MVAATLTIILAAAFQGQAQAPQPTPEEQIGGFEERIVDLEARLLALVTGFPKGKVKRPSPEDWKKIRLGMRPSQVRAVLGEPLHMENRVRPPHSYGYRGGGVQFRAPNRVRRGFGAETPKPYDSRRDHGTKVSSINGPTDQSRSTEERLQKIESVLGLGDTLRSTERSVGLKPGKRNFVAAERSDIERRLERIEAKLSIQLQGSLESRLRHIADSLVAERIAQSELRLSDFEKRVAEVVASPPDALFSFPRLSQWRSLRLGMTPAGVERVLGAPAHARHGDRRTEYTYTASSGLVRYSSRGNLTLRFEADRNAKGSRNRQGLTSLPEPTFVTSWYPLLLALERMKELEAPAQPVPLAPPE